MKSLKRSLFLCVCLALVAGGTVEAATATLNWNRNPEPQVTGYRLSIGHAPRVYNQIVDVGNAITWTVQNLNAAQTYYFAVQAYDAQGQLSPYSSEVVRGGSGPNHLDADTPAAEAASPASLFWQHENGSLSMWSMNGAKTVDVAYLSPDSISDPEWRIVGAGDFDRDHITDLVWQHRGRGEVAIWLMDGPNQRRSVTVGTESNRGWTIVAVGDMNSDTDPDLIWQNRITGTFAVWFMQGTSFRSAVPMNPGRIAADTSTIVGAADFDLDGSTDLLWQHEDGWMSVWLMDGVTMRGAQPLAPSSIEEGWRVVAVADYDRDGHADLVLRKDDGHLAMWFMNGLTMKTTTMLNPKFESDLEWKIVGPK